jgi:uncharacterized Zn-binding protein involved in type VI secretion
MVTIKVNGTMNGLVHKGGMWTSVATLPDVCKTPTPGGPVPMPYPNIAQSNTLASGSTTVKVDGSMGAIKGSKFAMSTGDEPGTLGGIKSNVFKQAATWITYSFDVKIDGKNACRFTDKMFHNNENTVDAAGAIPLVVFVVVDEVKMKCGELNQYGKQKKVSGKNKRDRDHIPSKSALKAKAKAILGKKLTKCIRDKIDNGALSIVIPKAAHQQVSPTYGQSPAEAEADAKNLQKSAKRDTKAMEKDIKKYDKACEQAYKKAARKINKITNRQYTNWIKKIIAEC